MPVNQPPLILIVDDDPNFREIFSAKLQGAGFRAHAAESGKQGIEDAKNLKPDLILMDVRMPEMDGIEAASGIRENPQTKDIKIVFLTAFGEFQKDLQLIDKKFSEEFGVAGYIRKSDDLDGTVGEVRKYLAG